MCRFHARDVYNLPIMTQLDYSLRLDDDSKILRPINYDIFSVMREKGYSYGFVTVVNDIRACVTGLWESTCRYIRERSINTQFFNRWNYPRMYYNNFEVAKMSFWRSCAYRSFVDYVDRLGGIYYHRWGDAPIKSIAISMFLSEKQVHHFDDIGYEHPYFIRQ